MKCILNLKQIFKQLDDYKYLFVKTENIPYMPSNFPDDYAIGKDLDIMVKEKDIDRLKNLFNKYAENYREDFQIILINEAYGFRIRFEVDGKLHFQFDVKYMDGKLSETFMESMLNNRKLIGDYYISDERHELIIRMLCYTPRKPYHLTYIKNKIESFDSNIVPPILKNKVSNIIKDI